MYHPAFCILFSSSVHSFLSSILSSFEHVFILLNITLFFEVILSFYDYSIFSLLTHKLQLCCAVGVVFKGLQHTYLTYQSVPSNEITPCSMYSTRTLKPGAFMSVHLAFVLLVAFLTFLHMLYMLHMLYTPYYIAIIFVYTNRLPLNILNHN